MMKNITNIIKLPISDVVQHRLTQIILSCVHERIKTNQECMQYNVF